MEHMQSFYVEVLGVHFFLIRLMTLQLRNVLSVPVLQNIWVQQFILNI